MDLNIISHLQALNCLKESIKTWSSASCLSSITVFLPSYCASRSLELPGCRIIYFGNDNGTALCNAFNSRFKHMLCYAVQKNRSNVQCFIDYDVICVNHEGLSSYVKAVNTGEVDCLHSAMKAVIHPFENQMLSFSPLIINKASLSKVIRQFKWKRFLPQDIILARSIERSGIKQSVFGKAAVTPATFRNEHFSQLSSELVFVGGVKHNHILQRILQRKEGSFSSKTSLIRQDPGSPGAYYEAQEEAGKLLNPRLKVDLVNKGIALQGVPNFMSESGTLFSQNYYIEDPKEIWENHRQWGRYASSLMPENYAGLLRKNKRPTIGFISHDFNGHVVGQHLASLIKHLSCRFNYILYDTHGVHDELNNEFKQTSASLRDVSKLYRDYDGLTDYIRKDNLDLAIDLSGHSAGNVLPIFSRRLAPKQATFLGYCHSTGLSTIDYRIVDAISDPVVSQQFNSEKLIYFPRTFLCYHHLMNTNQLINSRYVPTDKLRLGSFNNPLKMGQSYLRTVAKLLQTLSTATLILKHSMFANEVSRNILRCRFLRHGISSDRIQFLPYTNSDIDHLKSYDNIDISIDCFPYNGTTTTADALLAGCPVACILGNRHASRVSASILSNCEEQDWIASDDSSLIELVCKKASDPEQLYVGRLCRRQKYLDFNDPLTYAKDFETLIEQILS